MKSDKAIATLIQLCMCCNRSMCKIEEYIYSAVEVCGIVFGIKFTSANIPA